MNDSLEPQADGATGSRVGRAPGFGSGKDGSWSGGKKAERPLCFWQNSRNFLECSTAGDALKGCVSQCPSGARGRGRFDSEDRRYEAAVQSRIDMAPIAKELEARSPQASDD